MDKNRLGWLWTILSFGMILLVGGCAGEEILYQVPETVYLELEQLEEAAGSAVSASEQSAQPDAEEGINLLMEDAGHFAYDSLTEAEQIWYRDMEQCLGSMEENTYLSDEGMEAGLDESCIDTIFQCVMYDHPEIFYVDGYSYSTYSRGDNIVAFTFTGTYNMEQEEALSRQKVITACAEEMLAGISMDASDYDKVKYVYETLILSTDYDLDAPDNQNIYSVFVNHRSVCLGYAKAAQYLLNRLGMECTLVQGTVDTGEGHAWNLVKVDGSYYYMDATWGDASYQMNGETEENSYMPAVNYDYLCVTTQQLLRTHTLGGYVPMPECTAMEANYYVRENALFSRYNREQMTQLFERAKEQQKPDVTVKCTDYNCFLEVRIALIDNQEIFDYMEDKEGEITYASNEKQLSITFWTR